MTEELRRYGFQKMPSVTHYDPNHKIHEFFMERKRPYAHQPLSDEEPFRNVVNESELKKIRIRVHQDVRKVQNTMEAGIGKRMVHVRRSDEQESTSKTTQFLEAIQEPIGQYASMRGKHPIEHMIERMRATMDTHDVQELERVALEKEVRCVRNARKDATPPPRPPRMTMPPTAAAVPEVDSPSSNPLYEPDDEEKEEGRDEVDHSEETQKGKDHDEEGQIREEANGDGHQSAHGDDESLEILDETKRTALVEAVDTRKKGKAVEMEPASEGAKLKRPSSSRTPQAQDEHQLSAKRAKKTPAIQETVVETHQPPPNEEWGIDMDECLDMFNMDVGEEYEGPVNAPARESSTRARKSQTYVHMTDNAIHIKTLVATKDNPQNPDDLKQTNQIIHTGPIGVVGRNHAIMSNTDALTKEVLEKEKKNKALKKLAAQCKLTRELEVSKLPSENLRKVKPLMDGMMATKQHLMEVLTVVEQFINTLLLIVSEEKKLADVVTERVRMLRILDSRKPTIMRISSRRNLGMDDTKFLDDYWHFTEVLSQIATRWQEIRVKVDELNDSLCVH